MKEYCEIEPHLSIPHSCCIVKACRCTGLIRRRAGVATGLGCRCRGESPASDPGIEQPPHRTFRSALHFSILPHLPQTGPPPPPRPSCSQTVQRSCAPPGLPRLSAPAITMSLAASGGEGMDERRGDNETAEGKKPIYRHVRLCRRCVQRCCIAVSYLGARSRVIASRDDDSRLTLH